MEARVAAVLCVVGALCAAAVLAMSCPWYWGSGMGALRASVPLPPPPIDPTTTAVCPGSPWLHATCSVTFQVIDFGCKDVREEVVRRVLGKDNWVDPHKRPGTYALLNDTSVETYFSVRNGQGLHHAEKVRFVYVEKGSEGCQVHACSSSEGFLSRPDVFSTNYCNMHNMVCGEGAFTHRRRRSEWTDRYARAHTRMVEQRRAATCAATT